MIFIKNTDIEKSIAIYAIDKDNFETVKISETYARFGQQVGADVAGDSIELHTKKSVDLANAAKKEWDEEGEDFKIMDYISAYDNWEVFSYVIDPTNELEEGVDYEYYALECEAYTYWDGNNFQSIVIESEDPSEYSEWDVIEGDEEKELIDALEEMEYVKDGFGKRIYEGGEYIIVDSYCQGAFAKYEIFSKYDISDDEY